MARGLGGGGGLGGFGVEECLAEGDLDEEEDGAEGEDVADADAVCEEAGEG